MTDRIVPQPVNGVTVPPEGEVHLLPADAKYGKREGWVVPADDHSPVGARNEFSSRVRQLVVQAGDVAREKFAAPEVVADYVEAIHLGIKQRDRTALNLYAKMMKLIDEERRITVEFLHSFGVKDEGELKRYVEAAKSVEGAGPHEGAERCVAYLEAYLNAFPEQRSSAVKRLGGYAPVESG